MKIEEGLPLTTGEDLPMTTGEGLPMTIEEGDQKKIGESFMMRKKIKDQEKLLKPPGVNQLMIVLLMNVDHLMIEEGLMMKIMIENQWVNGDVDHMKDLEVMKMDMKDGDQLQVCCYTILHFVIDPIQLDL